jgi:tetratricopeptide (TPR) repeat protein
MKRFIAVVVLVSIVLFAASSCRKKGIQERLKDAQQAFDRGELPTAVMEATKITEQYPNDPEVYKAYVLLANAYGALRNYEQSRQQLQKIVDLVGLKDVNGQMALSTIIRLYAMEQRFDAATTETLKALQSVDEGTQFHRQLQAWLGQFYEMRGEFKKSRDVFSTMLKNEKDEAVAIQALDMLTGSYARAGDYADAVKAYQNYLEEHPDSRFKLSIEVGMGYYYEKSGDVKKAKEYYNKGLKGYEEAIAKAVEVGEKADLTFQLARSYDLKGDKEKARALWEKIVTDYPQTNVAAVAADEIAKASFREKNYDKAMEMFKLLEDKYPQYAKSANVASGIAEINRIRSQAGTTSPTLAKTTE